MVWEDWGKGCFRVSEGHGIVVTKGHETCVFDLENFEGRTIGRYVALNPSLELWSRRQDSQVPVLPH